MDEKNFKGTAGGEIMKSKVSSIELSPVLDAVLNYYKFTPWISYNA